MTTVQIAPHDVHAEQAVLGAALLAPALISQLATRLCADDFHRPAHAQLWHTLCEMDADGQPVDAIAVAAKLSIDGVLGKVGGAPYLHTLIASVPTTAHASYYADIITNHARRRAVSSLGTRLSQFAASNMEASEVVEAAKAILEQASLTEAWPPPIPLGTRSVLPAFPTEVLPSWVRSMVEGVAEFTQLQLILLDASD